MSDGNHDCRLSRGRDQNIVTFALREQYWHFRQLDLQNKFIGFIRKLNILHLNNFKFTKSGISPIHPDGKTKSNLKCHRKSKLCGCHVLVQYFTWGCVSNNSAVFDIGLATPSLTCVWPLCFYEQSLLCNLSVQPRIWSKK